MARRIPEDRFDRLVDAAASVFIEQGYRRTQMADVAAAAGIAKGTLYLYVESKDALFDFVLRHADAPRPLPVPDVLPIPSPLPDATREYVAARLASEARLSALERALGRSGEGAFENGKSAGDVAAVRAEAAGTRVAALGGNAGRGAGRPGVDAARAAGGLAVDAGDAASELAEIVAELYDRLARNARGIRLLDRSAPDLPELAALWFEGARGGAIAALASYLSDRIGRGLLRPVPNVEIAARLIIETAVFWAVHRRWDPHPQVFGDDEARETVLRFVVGALARDDLP